MSPGRRPTLLARLATDTALYAALFAFLAAQTAAASAQHAHDALVQGGQGDPSWLPWTLAGTPELLAVLATLEYRHRRHTHGPTADVRAPRAIIVASALVLIGAQLVTAQHTALGMFAAVWPALAFLVAFALVETRPKATPAVPAQRRPTPPPPPVHVQDDPPTSSLEDRLQALPPDARAAWDALPATPGELVGVTQLGTQLGWDRHRTRRAILPLLAAELVDPGDRPGQYAARAWVRPAPERTSA